MTYPLMDALAAKVHRMTLWELTMAELKRHGCLADLADREEILRRIYCPHDEVGLPFGQC